MVSVVLEGDKEGDGAGQSELAERASGMVSGTGAPVRLGMTWPLFTRPV
ncbi:MAG: hypothetical protein LBJ41_11485 [Treponema sp.]|nr:hypothetical protein [Treponema sp.]